MAIPKSPIKQPIIPVITGKNIAKDKIIIQIFKIIFVLKLEIISLDLL
ncbi:protein of unknown function [Clostridium beijerinckii]|nr:protein of unknown function [Clostridium beijerinckii]